MKKILLIIFVLINGASSAAIFQVNLTTQDHVDENPGNGVCEIGPGDDFCTLRAAIMEANALPGLDIIVLPGSATIRLSIVGANENSAATGDLDITDTVRIGAFTESKENFPTVDANLINDRTFQIVNGSGSVSLVNFKIINGAAGFSDGGAIHISTDNQVELISMWFEDNTADSGGAVYVSALSELDITDSVFTGNAAVSQGAAMTLFSPTVIDKSTIYDNLNFNDAFINDAFQETIFVGLAGFGSSGLTLRNSTLFDNETVGIYAVAADVFIRNSTIANHSRGGVRINPNTNVMPTIDIRNSVFNHNEGHCITGSVNRATDNWNITSDNAFCYEVGELQDTTTLTQIPQLTAIKTDPENWHRYYRPGFYSPVVDSAHPSAPGPGIGCDLEDQRGVVRPQDGGSDGNARCDRGAIELLEDVIFYDDFDIAY